MSERIGLKTYIILSLTILLFAVSFYGFSYTTHQKHVIAQLRLNVGRAFTAGHEQGRMEEQVRALEAMRRFEGSLAAVLKQYRHCLNPEQWAAWITQYAYAYQVPSVILLGLICQESSCNPAAESHVGAVGLTQIQWQFWGDFLTERKVADKREDLFRPEVSIHAGAAILGHLMDKYDGDIQKALDHYSGGASDYYHKIVARVIAGTQ